MARGNMKAARMNKNITKADNVLNHVKAGNAVLLQHPHLMYIFNPNNNEYMRFTTLLKESKQTMDVLIPMDRECILMLLNLNTTLITVL